MLTKSKRSIGPLKNIFLCSTRWLLSVCLSLCPPHSDSCRMPSKVEETRKSSLFTSPRFALCLLLVVDVLQSVLTRWHWFQPELFVTGRYQAVYNYLPRNEDELELKEGDIVDVMEKCDDGWFVGKIWSLLMSVRCCLVCVLSVLKTFPQQYLKKKK